MPQAGICAMNHTPQNAQFKTDREHCHYESVLSVFEENLHWIGNNFGSVVSRKRWSLNFQNRY
jgi:hypothetical protein